MMITECLNQIAAGLVTFCEGMCGTMHLLDLPDDLLANVICALSPEHAQRLCGACAQLRNAVASTPHPLLRSILRDVREFSDVTAHGSRDGPYFLDFFQLVEWVVKRRVKRSSADRPRFEWRPPAGYRTWVAYLRFSTSATTSSAPLVFVSRRLMHSIRHLLSIHLNSEVRHIWCNYAEKTFHTYKMTFVAPQNIHAVLNHTGLFDQQLVPMLEKRNWILRADPTPACTLLPCDQLRLRLRSKRSVRTDPTPDRPKRRRL